MTVRKQDFAETRSHVNDTEDMINFPLQIRSVEVSVLFVEPPDCPPAPIRISFRSKGQVDVAAFAQQFGGGGHARAAGAKIDGPTLDAARRRVVDALSTHLTAAS
jgi:phosphoesterase RecJ-like protein